MGIFHTLLNDINQTGPSQALDLVDFPAFVTGSTIYPYTGMVPHDLDMIIPVTPTLKQKLAERYGTPILAGDLNIICVTTVQEYRMWKQAKYRCMDECKKRRSTGEKWTKENAIEIHDNLRDSMKVRRDY